jgi:hypothetical protein
MRSNAFTVAARAPEAEYDAYGPMAKTVYNSSEMNPLRLQTEMQGQVQWAAIAADTLRDLSRIDAEIARSRAGTMSQINEQGYLNLTGQEQYINPHTGKRELGSNDWSCRWVNAAGEPIYTNDRNWDPNLDPDLRVQGYKRSPAGK